jgi:hypothetical protein
MIDSFPYDASGMGWLDADGNFDTAITTFWTFGPTGGGGAGDLAGTFVLTGLGILLMVVSIIAWVVLEDRKLRAQSDHLRAGGLG